MSIELTMPKLGLTMKTGKVSKWFVAEGAAVQKGDGLFEVETDKITNKVESPADGVLFQIVVPQARMRPCRRLWAFWPNRAKVPPGWRAERFPLPEKPRRRA